MAEPLELKKTLNLPKTDFPMKASLPQNEPKQLVAWQDSNLYERILEARQGKPLFVLHDGPPYPTGEIHLGTGLNKILKDLVVKTKSMAGHYAPYVPGWDCHGLPIETKVEKELGGKDKVSPAEFRAKCREFAGRYVEQHKKDFKRLGIFGRWNDPYLTMNFGYEAVIAGAFLDFMEKGYVFRGSKPVYWCIHDATALAEAEVEYENHTSPTVWVKYALLDDPTKLDPALAGKKVSTIIWTTTPWTLPASMAVAFHPNEEYVALESGGEVYIVASRLAKDTAAKCGLADPRELGKMGSELKSRNIPAILGPTLALPLHEDDPYDAAYALPDQFYKAGVKFAFGTFDNEFSRNLPYQAATAVAFGLPVDEAVKAVTLNAAQIWGVADRIGSIEEGKSADLMVTDGDPLEARTQVKQLYIKGKTVDLDNRQKRLYEKYLNRP